jgi:putative PEP-CTERM system TPR-repeat lipoprotein
MRDKNFTQTYKIIFWALLTVFLISCSGKTDEQLLQSAIESQEKGDDRTAIIHLKSALQKNPSNITARLTLGTIYVKYKDGSAAEKELDKARQLGAESTELNILLGRAYVLQGKNKAAINLLESFSSNNTADMAWAETILGDAYLGLKEFQKASLYYEKAIKRKSNFQPALIGTARLEIMQGDYEQARKSLAIAKSTEENPVDVFILLAEIEFLEKKYTAASELFSSALGLEIKKAIPVEESYIRTRLANSLVAEGKYKQGLEQIEILLKNNPNNPIPHYLRATVAFQQGDLSKASEHLHKVLKLVPDHTPSLLLLGAVNFGKGNFEQADHYLKSILDTDPTNTLARKWLGATRLKLHQPDEAVELIKPALKTTPSDPQLLDIMSNAALAKGDTQEAIEYLEQAVAENPELPALRSKLATTYLRFGDPDQAIKELEFSSAKLQQDLRAQALLVLSYAQKKDYAKAEELANILIDKFPNEPNSKNLLATVLLYKGDEQQAQIILKDLVKQNPEFVPALTSLAKIDYRNGDLETSQKYLEEILKIQPNNPNASIAYAQLLAKKGETEKAVVVLENARSQNQKALAPRILLARYYLSNNKLNSVEQILSELQKIDAKNPAVLLLQGLTELRKNQPELAKESLQKLTELQPKNAGAHYYLAQADLSLNQVESARTALRQSIQLQPKFTTAYWTLIQLEIRTGQFESAKQLVATVRKQFPESAFVDVLQGDLLVVQKDYQAALTAYQKAAQKVENSSLVLKQHLVLNRLNKKKQATKLFTDWLVNHPKDYKVRVALAMNYQNQNKNVQAIAEYKKALETKADDPAILNNVAWLLYEGGDKSAIDYAQKAYDLAPGHGAIADTLGWLYLENGRNEQGLATLEKAVELAPNVPDIRYHYAEALEKNGKHGQAKTELSALLRNHKNFVYEEEAKSLLQKLQ